MKSNSFGSGIDFATSEKAVPSSPSMVASMSNAPSVYTGVTASANRATASASVAASMSCMYFSLVSSFVSNTLTRADAYMKSVSL